MSSLPTMVVRFLHTSLFFFGRRFGKHHDAQVHGLTLLLSGRFEWRDVPGVEPSFREKLRQVCR